ncbi:MAG: VCBS repeat-containing protein [Acidobacteria bacterium]|nr:VCBS repeat-containing protein [Acidobacteriota bacterium]
METRPSSTGSRTPTLRRLPRFSFLVLALTAACGASSLPAQAWVDITGPDGVCPGESATLDAGPGYASYAWSTGESTQTIEVYPAYPGETYTVTVTDGEGNPASDDHWVGVYDSPAPDVTGPDHLCLGEVITLDAGAGYTSYLWSPGGETTQTIDVSPGVDTSYSVTVSDANGCTGTAPDFLVTVWDYPGADILGPFEMCQGDTITLTAWPDGCEYYWSTGETNQSIDISPASSEYYSVTVSNPGGCESTYNDYLVTVYETNAITGQPEAVTVQSGDAATLSVTAVGDSLVYQWYRGLSGDMSVPVSDNSSFLTTDPLTDTTPFWVQVQGNCGPEVASDTAWVTVRQTPNHTADDFNGDGIADVLWRNDTGGVLTAWLTGDGGAVTDLFLGLTGGTGWQVKGTGDFDGDGRCDILWRDVSTGGLSLWLLGPSGVASSPSPGSVDTAWVTQGTGDVNGDGKTDLFWRNDALGLLSLWFLDGGTVTGSVLVGTVATTDWQVIGVADFNGDGKTDLLWRHVPTGAMSLWFLNAAGVFTGDLSPGTVDPAWRITGLGDLDRDGCADIFWRHAATGTLSAWLMSGTGIKGDVYVGELGDPDWKVAGTGDFNQDGHADLLWRHAPSGTLAYWYLSQLGFVGTASPGAVDLSWLTQNHVNLNGFPAG